MRETAHLDIKEMHFLDCKTKIEKIRFCHAGCKGC